MGGSNAGIMLCFTEDGCDVGHLVRKLMGALGKRACEKPGINSN